ncbi:FAD-dependent tricarballylate dehydrogenase TcuA [Pelagibacterales bacterium SAG-MED35]|jgi:tricarballylate dehydrogenase|nr:FAD-dependent tricarballylate dehydrogenase TcuA [Pelagibacterales bacterium SAG-MED35]|tara:strand:- start:89 stop:1558 length:1470 start_codon:yes stop_codon:yes gene_type:complete
MINYDVVVIGAGNAALSAALSAKDNGAEKVLVLEKASLKEKGGNSRYTNGAYRFAYDGFSDLKKVIPNLKNSNSIDYGKYSVADFLRDMNKVTQGKTDKKLSKTLTSKSFETIHWLSKKGLKFTPIKGRQSFKVNGIMKYWGGLTLEVDGQGEKLIESMLKITKKNKIDIQYDTAAVDLIYEDNIVKGVEVISKNKPKTILAKSIILACGGFESSSEMRTRYLGPGWEMAKVRGTKHNTGDGLTMALKIGASPFGNWSGCHAVFHDMNGPEFSDLKISNKYRKISYPWGIVLNADGDRFVDEGEDFRNFTYAKFGKEVIKQPNQIGWQIFDHKVRHMLYPEYDVKSATMVKANSIKELLSKITSINSQKALKTINEYNEAVKDEIKYDPTIKDGKCTEGLKINKTNWANKIDKPPYYAYGVTCGITFTFGGLRVNEKCQVLNKVMKPIKGLYAAGEMIGGIFYFNYPGGSGLTSGAVFGKIAGRSAAKF